MAMRETETLADIEDRQEVAELEDIRRKCLESIRNRVGGSRILGKADVELYEKEVLSDKALARVGKITHKEKIQYIREVEHSMLPALLDEAKKLESTFLPKIEEAKRNGWISEQSANRWIRRLCDRSVAFHKKHVFISSEDKEGANDKNFLSFLKNWKAVAEQAAKLRTDPRVKKLTTSEVPQLSAFLDSKQFLNLSFKNREALLKTVIAAASAKEKQMPQLFAKAKAMLDGAVRRQAISGSKVGGWLQRIFSSHAKANDIEDFLNNKGSMPLQKLIDNWMEASKHFQKIEAKRKALGTPPGFHFVKMDVFLNWKYDQRQAYLNEAEHRFTDIDKEPGLFLRIRHELGSKDWEAAEELIAKARAGENQWGVENERKLQSMETFLRQHRTDTGPNGQKKKEQTPPDSEVLAEMQGLIRELPPQLQRTYIKALNRGYQAFWALTTLMYNRVWCHQHNFLDTGKERRMEAGAKEKTRERLEKGHQRYGIEVNVVKGDTNERAAVRDQAGVKGAQILYTDETSDETLVDEINEQKNDRNFWYWTSMIPQGVTYSEHAHIVSSLHPRMKKLARLMGERGLRYPLSFDASDAKPDHVVQAKK